MTWKLLIIRNESFLRPLYEKKIKDREKDFIENRTDEIDSGFDLFIPPSETEDGNWYICPNTTLFIPLSIKLVRYSSEGSDITKPYKIHPRSSIWRGKPIRLSNCTGIIDAGYRGELGIALDNIRDTLFVVEKGWRLVQACSPDLMPFKVRFTDKLNETGRGESGFGSTGQ
jgi:deoxyuridine 5'-triphosphate nucleotidohydrolase